MLLEKNKSIHRELKSCGHSRRPQDPGAITMAMSAAGTPRVFKRSRLAKGKDQQATMDPPRMAVIGLCAHSEGQSQGGAEYQSARRCGLSICTIRNHIMQTIGSGTWR